MSRLLVVDDRRDICEVLEMYLKDLGHAVTCASDGVAAQRMAERETFDVAIIDVTLPGLSGLDLARAVNQRGTPIILISGDPPVVADLESRSPYTLLTKPFHLRELGDAVGAALSRGSAAAEVSSSTEASAGSPRLARADHHAR